MPGEQELVKQVAELRKAQAELRKATAAADVAEKKVDQVKQYIAGKEFEARKLFEELSKPNLPVARNNELVGKIKVIENDIETVRNGPLKKYQDEFKTVNDKFIDARQAFIDKTLGADALSAKIVGDYEALGKEPDVVAALAEVAKQTGRPATLGPGATHKTNATFITTVRKTIDNESIPVTIENNVALVEVVLNGKVRRSMTLDTGAGLVCVPADLAKDLGLAPNSETPKINLQLADGKLVEGWLMKLASVQVGPFEVKDIECAVLPDTLVAATPLLGGSYLKNFVVKLDHDSAKLELTRIKAGG